MSGIVERLRRRLGDKRKDNHLLAKPWLHRYDNQADVADILSCFRLLLGRYPHAEEWDGHRMHIGDRLDKVVASYLNSWEFLRRELTKIAPAEVASADLPGFRIYYDLNDGAVGKFVCENNYEKDVTQVFRRLLRPGMRVLDIGANIGYFSMLSAMIVGAAGKVYAVEPNNQNVVLLEASRRVNGFDWIKILPFAASDAAGILSLTTSHSTGTTSTPPDQLTALLNSRIVPCVALDAVIPADARIDLIKIDVDGAEGPAMRGCAAVIARDHPMIISEFAPNLLPGISGINAATYLDWFFASGYEIGVIEPDGSAKIGQGFDEVMAVYERRGVDHVDILAAHPRHDLASLWPEYAGA